MALCVSMLIAAEFMPELRWVAGLRAVILRPHVLGLSLRRVVLDVLADPSDVVRVEQVRPEEAWFDDGNLSLLTPIARDLRATWIFTGQCRKWEFAQPQFTCGGIV